MIQLHSELKIRNLGVQDGVQQEILSGWFMKVKIVVLIYQFWIVNYQYLQLWWLWILLHLSHL